MAPGDDRSLKATSTNSTPAPSTARRLWLVAQLSLLAVVLVLAGRAVASQWNELLAEAKDLDLRWKWIGLSAVMVLAVHAMLIQTWRVLLAGWGSDLHFGSAVRIWTISNLGKYLPGKVWSIGALGVLAKREGVSGVAASGAALLNALLNLGAGFGVIALVAASETHRVAPWLRNAAIAGSVLFVVGVLALPRVLPPLLDRVAKWRKVSAAPQHVPASRLWLVTLLHALSWVGYGLAFQAFTLGVTPQVAGASTMFIAVYAASYLLGYLTLFAPGGIGVRESAMVGLLVTFGLALKPDAILLSLASRVWLTVVEVLPGLIALLLTPAAMRRALRRTQ